MLRAVAAASPATMKARGTYRRLKGAVIPSSKYSTPACRALALMEFMSSLPKETYRAIHRAVPYGGEPSPVSSGVARPCEPSLPRSEVESHGRRCPGLPARELFVAE